MSTTFILDLTTTFVKMNCPECAGVFAITESYRAEAERKGSFKQCWTCPYCKSTRGYGQSEADRLRADNARLERQVVFEQERKAAARKEADYFRKSRDGMKGALVKVKKRVSHGVCPCCNRTFINLSRHMLNKHPDFGKMEPA